MRSRLYALLALLMVFAPRAAHAGGGFFTTATSAASVNLHRMAVSVVGSTVTLWDQVQYQGSANDFVWVLPTPTPAQIALGDEKFFDDLENLTAPVVLPPPVVEAMTGGGCLSDDSIPTSSDGGLDVHKDEITVLASGGVGIFDATTVQSTSADALASWLSQNGYNVRAADMPVIAVYAKRGWVFNVVRFRPGVSVIGSMATQMTPLRVTWSGTSMALPLEMLGAGASDPIEILLWVFAAQRMATQAPYTTAPIRLAELDWLPPDGGVAGGESNYRDVFTRTLAEASLGGRGFIVEFAQPVQQTDGTLATESNDDLVPAFGGAPKVWLTRLRTSVSPSLLTADLTLIASADTGQISTAYRPPYQPLTENDRGAPKKKRLPFVQLALGLVTVFGLLRRRVSRRRPF